MDKVAAEEYLKHYCENHHIADVKGALWKWLVLSNKADAGINAHVQSQEFTEFYDELIKMITCLYAVSKP